MNKSYSIHNELNPKLWVGDKLIPQIRKELLEVSELVMTDVGDDLEKEVNIDDIYFLGSNTGYNYTPYSDIDLHLIMDFDTLGDEKLIKNWLDSKRTIWNIKHDIFIKGYEVEIYFQDKDEKNATNGIYSVLTDKWVHKPDTIDKPDVDETLILTKVNNFIKLIDSLSKKISGDITQQTAKTIHSIANDLKTKIRDMRKSGLSTIGEYSVENLAFKVLRNKGYLEKLETVYNKSFDKTYELK